jgi:Cdc6-like AAA superfamily ATPase
MSVDSSNEISVITQKEQSTNDFISQLNKLYHDHKNKHLIIELNNLEDHSAKELLLFVSLSNKHKNSNKSFVIVANAADPDAISEELVVVPTLQEAYDIIEMESMERDLGF